jgi:hypothetical protein
LWRAVKIALLVVAALALLFILLAVLIQVPAIQSSIVHRVTKEVSDKTGTTVRIDKVRIAFPKTVVVRGIFLDDLQQDTLLSAGSIKVNIALRELLFKKINVNSFALEDVTLNLSRDPNDSLFNYYFLIAAFTDTTAPPPEPSSWSFSIDRLNLDNIHARYDDRYGGMDFTLALQRLRLGMDGFGPGETEHQINRLVIDGLQGDVVMAQGAGSSGKSVAAENGAAGSTPDTASSASDDAMELLPKVSVKRLAINGSSLSYKDLVSQLTARADLDQFELTNGAVDLENETVTLEKLLLAESRFHLTKGRLTAENENNGNIFDANNLDINLHIFSASDLYYSSERIGGTISSFGATDQNGFAIEKFEGVFSFDDQSFAAEKLQLATTHSAIAADLRVQYPSLQMLQDSIALVNIILDLQQLQVYNSDILYFVPQLSTQPFMADTENSTSISGDFSGRLADLEVADLQIETGEQTSLTADFTVTGLPEIDSLMVSLPGLTLASGRQDIGMLAGRWVPEAIVLPERLSLEFDFQGMLNDFESAAELESSFGDLALSAILSPNEAFSGRVGTESFNLGQLLGDTAMYGPVTVSAEVTGSGLERSSLNARVDVEVSGLFLNSYVYRGLHIDGTFSDQMFEGRVELEDENLVFGFEGLVNLQPGEEQYQFRLDLEGAALQELNFIEEDIRMSLVAEADVSGPAEDLQGRIDLLEINAVREEQLYILDSLTAVFSNTPGLGELQVSSKLLEIDYTGTIPPTAIIAELEQFINGYFAMRPEHGAARPDAENEVREWNVDDGGNGDLRDTFVSGGNVALAENDRTTAEAYVITEVDKGEQADNGEKAGIEGEGGSEDDAGNATPSDFSFTARINNHPILSEVFLPGLTSFEPIEAEGQFDREAGLLELDVRMNHLEYGAMEINDLKVVADTDSSVVRYAISAKSISAEQVALSNLLFAGNVGEHGVITEFTSVDDDLGKKLAIHTHLTRKGNIYRLEIDPDELFLMYDQWEIDPGNQILFGEEGMMIDRLFLQNGARELKIASVDQQFNGDLSIDFSNFRLGDLSQIIESDSGLVEGTVDGAILVKSAGTGSSGSPGSPDSKGSPDEENASGSTIPGIIADATISNLVLRGIALGDLSLTTTNPSANRYDLNAVLSGAGNDLAATGHIVGSPSGGTMDVTADIASLSMKTVEAFSAGEITETAGTLSGTTTIRGPFTAPEITGELHFSEVFLKPAVLNNRLQVADETVELRSDGLYFDTFTVTDPNDQSATIDGSVKMQAFDDIVLGLKLKADDFLLMNTTVCDNETVFGRMVIDSEISIRGPLDLPEVSGRLKLKEGSHATFVVPESRLTTDRGENVVRFEGPEELHRILEEGTTVTVSNAGFTGIDLSTIFEIDRKATLRLLMDPTSTDSLVVQGEAALSLSMDRSGKVSLTGVYNISEGSYLVSLESVIKRRFVIVEGSSITWNGDPLDATLSLDARYTVRASPYDLVAAQMSGLSDADKGAYRQQVPFWVLLKLRGDMLQPEISFAIELPEEEKGALGGALNQKLAQLNQDASSLNKQVFALLLLGRFMQENPLQTEGGSTAAIVRSTVGSFLSAQLNRLGAGVLPGTELNVDIQSYEEYETETPQGRTEVEVGIKQQLFNERLSVQVGGSVDVEGERAMQNQASEITGDVKVEYKLTEDGRLRLKGFRQSRYEGALEGQIIETGAGVSYVRDFNEWRQLFWSSEREKKEKKEKKKNNKENNQEKEDKMEKEDKKGEEEKEPEETSFPDKNSIPVREKDPAILDEPDSALEKITEPSKEQDLLLQLHSVKEQSKILEEQQNDD